MILIVCQKRINEFQTLCGGFKVVKIIKLCYVVPWWLNKMGFKLINLCSNLVPVWACNIQRGLLLQHTSFKISFVRASNAIHQMLFCCIVVFPYFSIICQCGPSANAFATTSATTLVSVRNTRVFRTALTALTEPRTLWRRITRYLPPRRWGRIAYIATLLCGDVYAPSEGHVCYTLRRGCSYAEAVYTMPGDVKS